VPLHDSPATEAQQYQDRSNDAAHDNIAVGARFAVIFNC